jgi:predicted nucleotidyltransferase
MNNLNNLLKVLLEGNIDFVLIGGYAGVVHGSTQVTRDLDICSILSADGIQKLRDCLKDLHPKHRMNPNFKPSFLEEPKSSHGIKNIYLETDMGVLDIISEVSGIGDFEKLKASAVEISLFGHKCSVISIEDLIKAKETLGRDKDKIVARELRALLTLRK